MSLLGHLLVNTEELDFSSQEEFAESVSYYSSAAFKTDNLLYYIAKGEHVRPLAKTILGADEAVIFFSDSAKAMVSILKMWSAKEQDYSRMSIASKNQLAIITGTKSGTKKSALGLLLKGQPTTVKAQVKNVGRNFKTWKGNKFDIPDWQKKDTSGYGLKSAYSDAKHHNMVNNFFFCYVGAPQRTAHGLDMTVLIDKAINMRGLATWIKDGKGALTAR